MTSASLADPPNASVIVAAAAWLQGTLLGTVATVVAVIAVASVGFLMLSGRINIRYGATVVLGCFILFGASSIVDGLQGALSRSAGGVGAPEETAAAPQPPPPRVPPPGGTGDPYAGASVPARTNPS